ncbi:uncharacterized protein (TIGR02679 family) [Nakamurella sp. UYEF19]|uniref:TIGR02679 family protein n=1 Tax=Nakamurella sp. UYEF19 TaxID=1756392 RepID=UPI003398797E
MSLESLQTPAWSRLLALARRRLERTGGELSGSITLSNSTDEERRLIIGITGVHRPVGVKSMKVDLADLDDSVHQEHEMSLVAALALLHGPVRNRPVESSEEDQAKSEAIRDVRRRAGAHAGEQWFRTFLDQLTLDGTITRLVRRGDADQLGWAGEVLALLPAAQPISIPVLAERATGNTKALSGTPIATLVLRALAARAGVVPPANSEQRRDCWESAGVVMDDLSSQVLVVGLRPRGDHVVADWLRDAADFGIPFRLTLHQLTGDVTTLTQPDIWVCENPAVLRAAAAELEDRCAPLICTEGQPSAACHRLLARATGTVHWRGDFDWTGLRTTAAAMTRYGAVPWRMSSSDYLAALDAPLTETEPLKGPAAESPWEPELAGLMAERGRAVMEERIIPELIADLSSGKRHPTSPRAGRSR